jgi:adenylate cyclase
METNKVEETEIEKKFMIKSIDWKPLVESSKTIYQAYYLDQNKERKRIRIVKEDEQAIVAYKEDLGMVNGFLERIEREQEIDYVDGLLRLVKCNKVLVKRRNYINFNDFVIELDEFLNLPTALTMAEVEIKKEDILNAKQMNFPEWFGKDVTDSKKYRNASLIKHAQDSDFYFKELLNKPRKLKI